METVLVFLLESFGGVISHEYEITFLKVMWLHRFEVLTPPCSSILYLCCCHLKQIL